ncbi:ribosomal RNA-processing protein 7-domain-containing protein [Pseudomassariella vexata]|uniref:Ribosomal RNA-processing protein 7-domain-containing protein n=1 Tax=Pseudomassariella vexata TaxID=1141098 RepID=A0A1Y2EBJ5_9PEZI|nr:ribosomal RNA-processing protein 7-domain-containing protein [Pseudomassariella vexata]ORY68674.1 ribosomal RNA-processing protein 7-domain-containing protein [Pseudomassariella vexata]
MAEPTSSGDSFSVLPISIPPLPSFPFPATHHVFLRRNAKILTAEDSRSLFLVNVPVDSTEAHFRAVFASLVGAGRFEGITFEHDKRATNSSIEPAQAARLAAHSKKRKREDEEAQRAQEEAAAQLPPAWSRPLHRSGSSAVVLLADEKSVESVLKAVKKLQKSKKFPVWGEGVGDKAPPLGPQWLKAHNKLSYPGSDAMQASVDAYFTLYNKKEVEAADLAKRMRNEPDEDGFITVTRGGRIAPAKQAEAEEAKRRMLEREQKKRDATQNFYRFQLREKKKAEQAAFLNRFQEDKEKLRMMRERRGNFRPDR